MRARQQVLLGALVGALAIFVAGGALTAWVVSRTRIDAQDVRDSQFRQAAGQLQLEVSRRLAMPAYGLMGLRGTVLAMQRVPDAPAFRRAMPSGDLARDFPGVYGFGFIEPVPVAQLAASTARLRVQQGSGFRVDSQGRPAWLYVVRAIEPIDRNAAALGLDVGAEAVRREAVQRAIASDALAVSAPVFLRQGNEKERGAHYYLPVFAGDPDARQLIGLVYAPVNYPQMLSSLIGAGQMLDFSLVDITGSEPVTVYPGLDAARAPYRARYNLVRVLEEGGRQLQLTISSTAVFDRAARADEVQEGRFGALGVLLSAMLALLIWMLVTGRQSAIDLAGSMTAELERLATVARLTSDAVAIVSAAGVVAWTNPAFARLTGYVADEASGRPLGELLGGEPGLHDAADAVTRAAALDMPYQGETSMRNRSGKTLWVDVDVHPQRGSGGQLQGFVVILSNITERRAAQEEQRESLAFLQRTGVVAGIGGWQMDLATRRLYWTGQIRRIYEVPDDYEPEFESAMQFFPPEARRVLAVEFERALESGQGWDLELPFTTFTGRALWIRTISAVEIEHGRPVRMAGSFQDITARKRAEIALAEHRELLRVTLNSIGDAVVTTDAQARVTWINPVAESLTGWSAAEVSGRSIGEVVRLVNEETGDPVPNPVESALAEQRITSLARHIVLVARDGRERAIDDSAAPIRNEAGVVMGAVMVFHDVTAARALSREISHQARHDSLTGLPNRMEFTERLGRFLERADRDGEYGAVLFIDLDHFKIINDSCGHHAGDEVLVQVAGLLQACVRSHDTAARLGGDEFAVLLEGCPPEQAERIARAVCIAVNEYRYVASAEQSFRIGTSIGVVPVEGGGRAMDEVMRAADTACYIAKSGGRNRFHTWRAQDSSVQALVGDAAWAARLARALEHEGFELHAQRFGPLSTRAHDAGGLCAEVLLRLREDDGRLIGPGAFMAAAERYQLASRIDRWVVKSVFARLGQLPPGHSSPALVAINLSVQSIGDPGFHEFVKALLDRATFDVRMLCFEITEATALSHMADARQFLQAMHERGVRMALDEFGAELASFGYLRNFAVDFLKIDGRFVLGLTSDPLDRVSVRSFCEVAAVLGMQTIAEFVEREELLPPLAKLAVDFAQGFVIHRPEPLAHLLPAVPTAP
ncbi:EAL domain-containing protein [Dyella sp.]|uniref:EAL domain-containing protein n=1 Tax=Dyella sp. TaxID=1869338 RepID=UPI002D7733E7|nr:EAL domain-containing protein [Dyella sp.]HET6433350.1 EAL domain-containing protein [Dyella sp.]